MRDTSSSSSISLVRRSAWRAIFSTPPLTLSRAVSALGRVRASARWIFSRCSRSAVSGVFSSCEAMARNSSRTSTASSTREKPSAFCQAAPASVVMYWDRRSSSRPNRSPMRLCVT